VSKAVEHLKVSDKKLLGKSMKRKDISPKSSANYGKNRLIVAFSILLSEVEVEQMETAVYGCPLFNRNSECQMGESHHETHNH
jgi:hypothetical protein